MRSVSTRSAISSISSWPQHKFKGYEAVVLDASTSSSQKCVEFFWPLILSSLLQTHRFFVEFL